MRRLAPALVAAGLAGGALMAVAPPALAACDSYSGVCDETPQVLPTTTARNTPVRSTTVQADTGQLPFTGGEVALLATVGAAALGGGTILVFGARRRRGTSS